MSKKERTYLLYLKDMLQAMQRIQAFTEDMDHEDFQDDVKTQDAVVRNFEIIGEAANQIPTKVKERYSVISCANMYGLRNIVSHHYFGVDFSLIWKISVDQLPQNRFDLEQMIEKEKANQPDS